MFPLQPNRYTYGAYCLVAILLALIAFGSLSSHLLDGDDFEYLTDTEAVREAPSLFFSPDRQLPGRPTVELVFLIAQTFWGNRPAAYHILLIGLHLAASLLLACAFRRLGADLELSLLGALLFLINVAHFRAIQWISCLAYPLALIFGLASLICFLRYLESGRVRWMAWSVLTLASAIFAHASAVSIALFCIYLSRRNGKTGRQILYSTWPVLAVSLTCGGLLYAAYPLAPQAAETPLLIDPVYILTHLFRYLGRLLSAAHWLPSDLLPGLHPGADAMKDLDLIAGILVCLGMAALWRYRVFPASDWAVWAVLTLLPFLNRTDYEGVSRYVYLSSAGSSLILAWALRSAVNGTQKWVNRRFRQIAFAAVLVGLATLSVLSFRRAEAYAFYYSGRAYVARGHHRIGSDQLKRAIDRNPRMIPPDVYSHLAVATFGIGESPQEILEDALAKHPNASELKALLGICAFLPDDPELRRQGEARIREAVETAENEMSVRACAAVACFNLGAHFYQRPEGQKQAEALFRLAIRLRPGYPRAHFGLANSLSLQGKTGDAIQAFQKTIELQPDDAAAYQNLGFLLNRQGNHKDAAEALKRAIFHDPTRAYSWYLLAQAQRHTGKLDGACQAILNALEQSPSRSEYWAEYFYIGSLYHIQGQATTALPIYQAVVKAIPDFAMAHHNLGVLHYSQGRYPRAAASLERAVQLSPDNAKGHLALAQAYKKIGRVEEALQTYRKTLAPQPGS